VSSPWSARRQVARREHQQVLVLKPCRRCGEPFAYCHSCTPGRRYCDLCSPLARREREKRAHDTYYGSVEGRQQHHQEEHERRKRRRREAREAALVGGRDRRCVPVEGGLHGVTAAVREAAEESCGESSSSTMEEAPAREESSGRSASGLRGAEPVSPTGREDASEPSHTPDHEPPSVEWTLVAWPGLLAEARRLLGTEVGCPHCGRRGIVKCVLAVAQWRPACARGGTARSRDPP
jgi:hypothetical protein